jgi:nitroreductase
MNESIISALTRRYATKAFDPTKPVSPADLATIKESLRLAPSAYGIQPWTFVWASADKRAELFAGPCAQGQVASAPQVLVVAVKTDMTAAIEQYVVGMAEASGSSVDDLAGFKTMMLGTASTHGINWFQRQAYIALGFGLHTVAMLGLDSCPMEGFNADGVDEVLGLGALGLRSTVMMAVGYAAIDSVARPKFRFPVDQANITI